MELRILNKVVLVKKNSLKDDMGLILTYVGIFAIFRGGHFENHPKWWVGPKISIVNILILNQGGPRNNLIPLPESP